MTGQLLYEVLEATGYLADGQPAHGVRIGNDAHVGGRARSFRPDALWKGDSALTVYFKSEPEAPPAQQIAGWHREIWNQGFAPLLWVVSPEKIELYNGFGRPRQTGNAAEHRLRTFERIESELEELDAFAGRLAMETGRFWQEPQANEVDRKTSVGRQLLSDLAEFERDLVKADMSRPDAQGLIGRSIFTQYLIDRGGRAGGEGIPPADRGRDGSRVRDGGSTRPALQADTVRPSGRACQPGSTVAQLTRRFRPAALRVRHMAATLHESATPGVGNVRPGDPSQRRSDEWKGGARSRFRILRATAITGSGIRR